jgi:D-threo-aldose 1-dehydrogenase
MSDPVDGSNRMGRLGMGGAPLGNLFEVVSEADAQASLQAAWHAGIRHFDTAPHYGAGLSEHRMGAAMRGWPRAEFSLSTKVGRMLEPASDVPHVSEGFTGALPFRRRVDYSGPGALRSIEDSLQRLGLSRIDTVYIHDVSEDWHGAAWTQRMDEAMAGAARVLTELKRQGVIRAWGLGVNLVAPCLAALERSEPDLFLIAGRYTLLDHTALAELFPACAARGVRCVLGGPYNSGLLAGGTTFNYEAASPEMVARARSIAAVCTRHGVDIKAAALQCCAAHPVVEAIIPGGRNAAEVTQNAAMMQAPIPGQLWRDLRGAGLIPEHAPTPD